MDSPRVGHRRALKATLKPYGRERGGGGVHGRRFGGEEEEDGQRRRAEGREHESAMSESLLDVRRLSDGKGRLREEQHPRDENCIVLYPHWVRPVNKVH